MSKQDARDWREEQYKAKALEELREDQLMKLYHVGRKRPSNFPSPSSLRELGYTEAAQNVEQALNLLESAYWSIAVEL